MEWWQAVILGLVEGITEYLPISSTGHLIIASALLGLDDPERKGAVDAFNIVIQGGAILAVLGLYWPRVVQMLRGLIGKDAFGRRLLINLVVAFLPAAILGPLLNEWIQSRLFHTGPVLAALLLGGIWMIWLGRGTGTKHVSLETEGEKPDGRRQIGIDEMTWRTALGIGLFQVVAMWPGTSRSMMTIAGGTLLGLRPKDAAEFSFLLGLPTLGGATVFIIATDFLDAREVGGPTMFESLGIGVMAIGLAVATVSAAFAVRWLVAFLTRHGLSVFGWYRVGLCAVMGALALLGLVEIG